MQRPIAAAVAAVVAAAVATVTGFAVAGAGSHEPRSAQRSISATEPPTSSSTPVLSECWVPTPGGNVALTSEQAEELTTRAARALGRSRTAVQLAPVVTRLTGQQPSAARSVARSLLGVQGAERLNCSYLRGDVEPEKIGRSGLIPRAAKLRRAWTEVFGPLVAGGFARGGVSGGHVDNSAHYEGRAIDVFFRPYDSAAQRKRGWVFAQWLVAHAERYHVLSVIYADHIWTSWASYLGFRDYQHPGGPTRNPVLRHLDHVHTAVESGHPFGSR